MEVPMRKVFGSVVVFFLLGMVSGCSDETTVTLSVGGRTVTLRSRPAHLQIRSQVVNGEDVVMVQVGPDRIVVEKTRVLVNGEILSTIPESAKQIDIDAREDPFSIRVAGEKLAL
jgi:hypothetical protein